MRRAGECTVGEEYTVEIEDCCVVGTFTSQLIELVRDGEDVTVIFANGVTLTETAAVKFWKVMGK